MAEPDPLAPELGGQSSQGVLGATGEAPRYSPRAFLQSRRPERFSDSTFTEERTIDRQLLEYHLDTLTSRGQETDFERFAHGLAKRELCPNLLPQTGPTGGGDSKVDSETYPVAEDLAFIWIVGYDEGASRDRWAFAFSAKAAWRPKVRSDIAKVAATDRDYVRAYFITNQFVPDRKRAEVEDQLRKEHGLDVRILDRTWILDRVFEGGHEDLVEQELGLRSQTDRLVRQGPRDLEREEALANVEDWIGQAIQDQALGPPLASAALDAAEIARGLDRPRHEVDGLFARADRFATRYGTDRQRVEVAYQRAWTTYWWFEDEQGLEEQYAEVEARAAGSRNAYDLERLTNLWHLLYARRAGDEAGRSSMKERTATLIAELERLALEVARPSTALQAETFLLNIDLAHRIASGSSPEPVLRDLAQIVRQARGLTGFPLDTIVQSVTQLGEVLGDAPGYDELFEATLTISSEQDEGLRAARLLMQRGRQFLDQDRPRDAIRVLGRSFSKLYNHEGRHEAVIALYLGGVAYEQLGLLWAARGTLAAAASLATDELWRYGEVTRVQAACYRRLKWIELQLGRLPHVLAWHTSHASVESALAAHSDDPDQAFGDAEIFDASVAVLLLRAGIFDLGRLKQLPDGLERIGLPAASMALIYALGHDEEVWDRLGFGPDEREDFFVMLSQQPVADDLPKEPALWNGQRVVLRSGIFGCDYTVEADNGAPCVELAESILAAAEALLGSLSVEQAIAGLPDVTVRVRSSDFAPRPFSFEVTEEGGRPHFEVSVRPFDPHALDLDEQLAVREKTLEIVTSLVAHTTHFADLESTLSDLFEGQESLDRAFAFTSSFMTIGNVLGHTPPLQLRLYEYGREYPLLRTKRWSGSAPDPPPRESKLTFGKGDPPPDLDAGRAKHSEMQTVSPIRDGLWSKAGWSGVGFVHDPDGVHPPLLVLMFRNGNVGREIFERWMDEYGQYDDNAILRVALIRGVDRDNPAHYRVIVGSDPDTAFDGDIRFTSLGSRIHLMEPQSSFNLNRFLADYERHGRFGFASGVIEGLQMKSVNFGAVLGLKNLVVKDAWEIGRHDPDSVALLADTEPIIPEGVVAPPVDEFLAWRRSKATSETASPDRRSSRKNPRNQPCPCGSGKKFKHCHGRGS